MIEILRQRRSVRQFLDKPIESEKIELLKEAALRSPTSRNINPWRFVFVQDRTMLEKLSRAKQHGSTLLKGAALGIVVCGDQTESDVWVEDCSIASILIQLTAQSVGLGSCWVQIRKRQHDENTTSEDYVQQLLGLNDSLKVLSIIAIGYPVQWPEPIDSDQLQIEKVQEFK